MISCSKCGASVPKPGLCEKCINAPLPDEREAFLKEMVDTAWALRSRELLGRALLLARKMGETDGTKQATEALAAAIAATRNPTEPHRAAEEDDGTETR